MGLSKVALRNTHLHSGSKKNAHTDNSLVKKLPFLAEDTEIYLDINVNLRRCSRGIYHDIIARIYFILQVIINKHVP